MRRTQKEEVETEVKPIRRKAITTDARENQLINLAVDLAEKQLMEGTASAQVITHYLKLATTKERLEREILEKQRDLLTAKTEVIRSDRRSEELYAEALEAMRRYQGADEQ